MDVRLVEYLRKEGTVYEEIEHPPVHTLEEQAKYVNQPEFLTKNLLLKDKKNRVFLISCLRSTNLDLKGLAQRLGIGKGGVRCAPEETIKDMLKVQPVCVSPYALNKDTQSLVILLLDRKFQTAPRLLFHPLSNELTIAVSPSSLDKYLKSIGKLPVYVDFEASVQIGKEQPPDLACYVPTNKNETPNEPALKNTGPPKQNGKVPKEETLAPKHEGAKVVNVRSMSAKITTTLASKLSEEESKDLEHQLVMLTNLAYTEGYTAARSRLQS